MGPPPMRLNCYHEFRIGAYIVVHPNTNRQENVRLWEMQPKTRYEIEADQWVEGEKANYLRSIRIGQ